MLESLFNKVTGLKDRNFVKKRYQRRCFSVNIEKLLTSIFEKQLRPNVSDHRATRCVNLVERDCPSFCNNTGFQIKQNNKRRKLIKEIVFENVNR